jgi:tRNA (mo5U34)-methyltransferase
MNIQEKVNSFPFWYHHIDLGNGIKTPGNMPHAAEAYRIPDDLTGKCVLDVGAYDGYWTFEALKRGASQVVAIDDWSDRPWLDKSERIEWDTFDFCKETLGYTDEQCKRKTMSVYDVESLGKFDVVLFFGALYHMRHPLLVLDKLSAVCTGEIYIESAICNDYSPYKEGGYGNDNNIVMEFYLGSEYGGVATNWWCPTMLCMVRMIKAAGFSEVEGWKFSHPTQLTLCRGFAKGSKKK